MWNGICYEKDSWKQANDASSKFGYWRLVLPWALYKTKESETHPSQEGEISLPNVSFTINKFNNRPKPVNRTRILIISCFSEFGCETVGITYCIPRLLKRFPGLYIVAMGWHGRTYLYQHLVDEYWELGEEYMYLRNRTFAFHHRSTNLKNIEEQAAIHGTVIPSSTLGKYAVGNICKTCGYFWNEWRHATERCPKCQSTIIINSLFGKAEEYKKTAVRVPRPSAEKLSWASTLTTKPTVGVFARGRKTYGRNLDLDFYKRLLRQLQAQGYNPIWLGEKQSTLACPLDDVYDFSRSPDSRDLEKTLAIVCNCEFTIQFWTASSRLSGLMGVPFILFESPEQIYCSGQQAGQEGRRLELTSFGKRKLVIAHYLKSLKDPDRLLTYVDQAIEELNVNNCSDLISDLVMSVDTTEMLRDMYYDMVKGVKHG